MVDPVIQKRNRSNKRNGAMFETGIVKFLRELGYKATRISKTGARDEGDVSLELDDVVFVIEAKNVAKITLSDFIEQSVVQAQHYAEHRPNDVRPTIPLVVVKRRGKGIDDSYCVVSMNVLLGIIARL